VHFILHTAHLLALQSVAMLMLWLVALQSLKVANGRFHDVLSRVTAHKYANSTNLVGELITQIDAAVWLRVPKGINISSSVKEWNTTPVTIVISYDLSKLDQANTTAKAALDGAFEKAETLAVQTLFSSLGVSIPEEKDAEALGGAQIDKDMLLDQYKERFTLVFDYVYISCRAALMIMALIQYLSLKKEHRSRIEIYRSMFKGVCRAALCLICLVHTNHAARKSYMESAWMLPTLCIVLFLCVVARHVHPCLGGRGKGKAKRGDVEAAESVLTEPTVRQEVSDEKELVAMPAPTASNSRQHASDEKAWIKGD
jgi:hypothetical protein